MWIFTNHGFYSIVKDNSSKDKLLVRARRREHLEVWFDSSRVTYSPKRDYQYRVKASNEEVSDLLFHSTADITYTNFKYSITDPTLSRMAGVLWSIIFGWLDERKRPMANGEKEYSRPFTKDRKSSNKGSTGRARMSQWKARVVRIKDWLR
tara:strand:+ start:252 stop:704 length:453 start_codon:yes stop_codon:yes gene_type:complete